MFIYSAIRNHRNCLTSINQGILLSLFKIFNWRIISLQYCVDFCHTTMWFSHRYTYVPSLFNLPPFSHPSHSFWVSQRMGLHSLCYTAASQPLSILYMVRCMFHCYSLNTSHSLLPLLCPQVCFLHLWEQYFLMTEIIEMPRKILFLPHPSSPVSPDTLPSLPFRDTTLLST